MSHDQEPLSNAALEAKRDPVIWVEDPGADLPNDDPKVRSISCQTTTEAIAKLAALGELSGVVVIAIDGEGRGLYVAAGSLAQADQLSSWLPRGLRRLLGFFGCSGK